MSWAEQRRQQEVVAVGKKRIVLEEQRPIQGTMAVSIDAGKRQKLGEKVTAAGQKKYEIGFRDVKVAAISEVFSDERRQEAYCGNHSYVGGHRACG